MNNKRNILFVLPFLPWPLVSGGHQAIFNGIDCIKEDFNIYVAFYSDGKPDSTAVKEFQKRIPDATLLPMNTWYKAPNFKARVINKLQRILAQQERKYIPSDKNEKYRLWLWANYPQPAKWQEYICEICEKCNIDIVQVEMPWISSFILSLPDNVKKVYVHHELAFVKHGLELQNDSNNIFAKTAYKHTFGAEIFMLNNADHIITLSTIDKKKLQDAGVKTPITPSFAVVNSEVNLKPCLSDGKVITFVGPDDNQPNIVGLRWFLDNCWGKLKDEYELKVIGKWKNCNMNEILSHYPEVQFLGFVESLYEEMEGTVMIVPITIGSGIRMKILEAASMGIPFVSTTVGAEGIPLTDGKDCFLTDNPDTFVKDIKKLQEKELRLRFIYNANNIVREYYSIDALRNNRLKIYNNF